MATLTKPDLWPRDRRRSSPNPTQGATPMVKTTIRRAVLVYQAGIANVFTVDRFTKGTEGRNARRLYQNAFGSCETFARGLKAAGVRVVAMSCNRAGDIASMPWDTSRDDSPFRESWRCRGIPWFSRNA